MKTVFRSVLVLGVAAFLFTSCEKDVVSSDMKIDESKTAKVVLRVGAQLDLQKWGKTGIDQPLPSGAAKAIFKAQMAGFGLPAAATPMVKIVPIEGPEFTVELLASEAGVTWDVTFTEFTVVQKNASGDSNDSSMEGTSFQKKFAAPPTTIANLLPNDYRVLVVEYSTITDGHPRL